LEQKRALAAALTDEAAQSAGYCPGRMTGLALVLPHVRRFLTAQG
jgi:hypothetical protein